MRLFLTVLGFLVGFAVAVGVFAPHTFGLGPRPDAVGATVVTGAVTDRPSSRAIRPEVSVTIAEVEFSPPRDRVQSIGTGRALRFVTVTNDVAGIVGEVSVRANQTVEGGDALVTLERETQTIALESAETALVQAQAAFDRLQDLTARGSSAVSVAQMDEARTALAAASANRDAAQFEFNRRIIRAPFSGVVGLTDVEIGDYLPPGTAIVDLYDDTDILVEFEVPETAISAVQIGVPVRLFTPSMIGRSFGGRVSAVDAAINPQTRTLRVRASADNDDGALRPGMTFAVNIASSGEPMPVVPAVAVTWSRDGASVWRVGEDNLPERVPLIVMRRTGDKVWIEADLYTGDRVVTDGALKVRQGVPVVDLGNAGPGGTEGGAADTEKPDRDA